MKTKLVKQYENLMKLGYGDEKAEKVIASLGCRKKCEEEGLNDGSCDCADDKDKNDFLLIINYDR